jgi:hypothetical protein
MTDAVNEQRSNQQADKHSDKSAAAVINEQEKYRDK